MILLPIMVKPFTGGLSGWIRLPAEGATILPSGR